MNGLATQFWSACESGELHFQQCNDCGHAQNYPRPFCTSCGSESLSFVKCEGRGRVYSVSEVTRAPTPEFQSITPYYLALVDMDEGVRVMGHALAEVGINDRVSLKFRTHEKKALPLFVPI